MSASLHILFSHYDKMLMLWAIVHSGKHHVQEVRLHSNVKLKDARFQKRDEACQVCFVQVLTEGGNALLI